VERAPPAQGQQILRHVNPYGKKTTGRTTRVEVTVTDQSGDGVDRLPVIQRALKSAQESGMLRMRIGSKVQDDTGVYPNFSSFGLRSQQIRQWSLAVCKKHMKQVVERFEVAYTRRMVPLAIFNECTNFMAAASFSHDDVPTEIDVKKCRAATTRFATQWNMGRGPRALVAPPPGLSLTAKGMKRVPPNKEIVDMTGFCVDVCEHKFGFGSPWCHVTEGDQNLIKGK
jgi:hypothetical protein